MAWLRVARLFLEERHLCGEGIFRRAGPELGAVDGRAHPPPVPEMSFPAYADPAPASSSVHPTT
jgi:hypothetical protein